MGWVARSFGLGLERKSSIPGTPGVAKMRYFAQWLDRMAHPVLCLLDLPKLYEAREVKLLEKNRSVVYKTSDVSIRWEEVVRPGRALFSFLIL